MAEVNGEINLIWLGDVKLRISLLLHENSNKFITNFRSMLGIVSEAELLFLHAFLQLWFFFDLDIFALDFFCPAELVKALSEQNCVGQNGAVELFVDLLRYLPQV